MDAPSSAEPRVGRRQLNHSTGQLAYQEKQTPVKKCQRSRRLRFGHTVIRHRTSCLPPQNHTRGRACIWHSVSGVRASSADMPTYATASGSTPDSLGCAGETFRQKLRHRSSSQYFACSVSSIGPDSAAHRAHRGCAVLADCWLLKPPMCVQVLRMRYGI